MSNHLKPNPASAKELAERPEVRRIVGVLGNRPLALRDYHAIGRDLQQLEQGRHVFAPEGGWREKVAAAVSRSQPVSVATLNKCLQLANAYRPHELGGLERVESRWGMVSMALAVGDRGKRHALLRRAEEEGWNEARLRAEIKRGRKALSRGGGRTRAVPPAAGLHADLDTLLRLTRSWADFYAAAFGDPDRQRDEAARLAAACPQQLADRLGALSDALELLRGWAAEALGFSARVRREHGLPPPRVAGRPDFFDE